GDAADRTVRNPRRTETAPSGKGSATRRAPGPSSDGRRAAPDAGTRSPDPHFVREKELLNAIPSWDLVPSWGLTFRHELRVVPESSSASLARPCPAALDRWQSLRSGALLAGDRQAVAAADGRTTHSAGSAKFQMT